MRANEEYISPEAEVMYFADADVITASDEAGHTEESTEDTRLPTI